MTGSMVWWRLTVQAATVQREVLALLLVERGSNGVIEEGESLVAYFPPEELAATDDLLARFASDAGPNTAPRWQWSQEEGEPWRDAWKEHFCPARLSPRLAVCPSWAEPPEFGAGVQLIRLDPGQVFGTGTHETTRLCLVLLDRCLAATSVSRCLDVGCGSGILTVAAARLGVPRVVAVDIDLQAALATLENARRNDVEPQVAAICGDLRALHGDFPLVLANILFQILLGLAPEICSRVAPGGHLILSGLLVAELDSAARVYGAHGLQERSRDVAGDWGALLLRRPRQPLPLLSTGEPKMRSRSLFAGRLV